MDSKKKRLLYAIILGIGVLILNRAYIQDRVREYQPRGTVKVAKVKSSLQAGTALNKAVLTQVEVPDNFAPRSAIEWKNVDGYLGQELRVEAKSGDYLLESFFGNAETVATKLSSLITGANTRAVSLPVDETTSLGRSVVAGDRVDVLFTFQVPMTPQKMSTVLLQNVPVITTGSYSASDQEIGERGGRAKPYNIVTILLSAQDAIRLNYARQAGQVSLMLRGPNDTGTIPMEAITSVNDILSAADQQRVEAIKRENENTAGPNSDKLREQLKEIFEKQRQQSGR